MPLRTFFRDTGAPAVARERYITMDKRLEHFTEVISDDITNALDGCDLLDYVDKQAISIVIGKGGSPAIYEGDLRARSSFS